MKPEGEGEGRKRGGRNVLSTFLMIAFKSLPSISFFKFPSSVAVLISSLLSMYVIIVYDV